MKTFDVIVIGSGPAGYVAAISSSQKGLSVCCIEKRNTLGGTCLNIGCIPSKALLHSTELFSKVQNNQEGILFKDLSFDFAKMQKRKEEIVQGFTQGIAFLFKKNKVTSIEGTAKLTSPTTVEVNQETISAKYIILATGSEPISLPFLPFDEKKVLSSTGALSLPSVPKKLLVIGAGVIGVELGSVYARLGSEVCYVEFLDRICPGFDLSLSKALQKSLSSEKVSFHLSHKVIEAKIKDQVELVAESKEGKKNFSGECVLVCIGRRPFTEGLNLKEIGVQTDQKGLISIDTSFRTTVPNIFAIGDVVEGPMLAHKASEEGTIVSELIAGKRAEIDYFSIPNACYTHPEVASVGLTEEECQKRNLNYKVGQFPFKANSRAKSTSEGEGFVKILAEEKSRKLLGIHIIGDKASELINEAALCLKMRLTSEDLKNTCHAHPTLSEALKEAALSLFGKAIHI